MNRIITKYFEADHDRLDLIFSQYKTLRLAESEHAHMYLLAFGDGLLQHIRWEEDLLFPAFEENTGMLRGPTTVMRMEHEQILTILEQLKNATNEPKHVVEEIMQRLEAVLLSHNEKEENILYPMIDNSCSTETIANVFLSMA